MVVKSCYIAGPMRGLPEYNYPAFMEAEKQLQAKGWVVYNPARMDIQHDKIDHAKLTLEEQRLADSASAARRFAARDTNIIIQGLKAEDGDIIVVLPGWSDSVGAQAEVAIAEWVMLPVLTLQEALRAS